MEPNEIELGKKYKDSIHGIEGIATIISVHLGGYSRVCIELIVAGEIKDYWCDANRLEAVSM